MFPVGDFLHTRETPYVNWTLIAINIAVFLYTLTLDTRVDLVLAGIRTSEADRFLIDWGFIPACLADFAGISTDASPRDVAIICPPGEREILQPVSSMFVHAGWAHILGNMVFLWIFGDNVEDRMGHARYLLFYLLCGFAAAGLQTFMALDTVIPNVGASGAIAGIMGAYLVLYPKQLVQVIIFPLFFIPFTIPAAVLIGFWFVTQIFSGLAEVGRATAGSGVAWWAHIGGFVAGAILIWLFRRPDPRRWRRFSEGYD